MVPSLLCQLMSGEVFNENSCILQCLKFIVDEKLIPVPEKEEDSSESDTASSDGSETTSSDSDTTSSSDESEESDSSTSSSSDTSSKSSSPASE